MKPARRMSSSSGPRCGTRRRLSSAGTVRIAISATSTGTSWGVTARTASITALGCASVTTVWTSLKS